MSRSNSNVQRYIYTAKEINRRISETYGAIAPTTAIQAQAIAVLPK
ncbi:hypothetical protein QUA00_31875 [Microcoleus sp. T2B6]